MRIQRAKINKFSLIKTCVTFGLNFHVIKIYCFTFKIMTFLKFERVQHIPKILGLICIITFFKWNNKWVIFICTVYCACTVHNVSIILCRDDFLNGVTFIYSDWFDALCKKKNGFPYCSLNACAVRKFLFNYLIVSKAIQVIKYTKPLQGQPQNG